jgi:hypothetical protein
MAVTAGAGAETDAAVIKAKKVLFGGLVTIAAGLAIAGTMSQIAGGVVALAGWLGSIYGLHRFGRAGSDH